MARISTRQGPIVITFVLAAALLCYKLVQIQLLDNTYKQLANKTILDKQTVFPSRGLIYDRNGKLLTFNKPIYDLEVIYKNIDPDMDTTLFCDLLCIDKETFNKNLDKDWSDRRYHKSLPCTFLSKIDPEIYSRFQEHLFQFPGFYPIIRNIRAYPHNNAAHVLGYLGEADMNVINKNKNYQVGDYLGIKGIEKSYEDVLKGKKGVKFLLKDNVGREVSSFASGDLDSLAIGGIDIQTSIDLDLQAYCEELMTNKRGSIVALEPSTGEIITMLSAPGYDPNLLNLDEDRGQAYQQLTADKVQRPLFDRSIAARYPPGSIFKPILTLIALQEGVTYPTKYVPCDGDYHYRTFSYGCHAHTPTYNVQIALEHSCNSYFFSMVRDLIEIQGFNNPEIGLNVLRRHLYDFGLGRTLGVDLDNEVTGYVPTPEHYDRLYQNTGANWKSTYIMSIGIGQGELELTTLQMANLAAIIANRGYYYTPHIVKEYSDSQLKIDESYTQKNHVRIDPEHFVPVIKGMERVIRTGTGYKAHVHGINICGKTGTSQNSHGEDHSVFFAFAPKDNPKIAIATYIENAGFGGDIAAPISGLIIEKYLNGQVRKKNQEAYIKSLNLLEQPDI